MPSQYESEISLGQAIFGGIELGERRSALRQMEAKFGPLTSEVRQKVEALTSEALAQLQVDLLKAQSLGELHLDD